MWGARWNSSMCTEYTGSHRGNQHGCLLIPGAQDLGVSSSLLVHPKTHIRLRPSTEAQCTEIIPSVHLCLGNCSPTLLNFPLLFWTFKPHSHSLFLSNPLLSCPQWGRTRDISLSAPSLFPNQLIVLPMTRFCSLWRLVNAHHISLSI